jgi:lipopolysaccharide/colanic/teichoic acid biosynthesis glycosyltransferase
MRNDLQIGNWKGKRTCDVIVSLFIIAAIWPILLIVAALVVLDSRGGAIFIQVRVGQNGKQFKLIKFRTMVATSAAQSKETMGKSDFRITRIGRLLRKTKIDELPQLINIIKGEMSFVGPRPEIPCYVDSNDPIVQTILRAKPGLTDYATLEFIDLDAVVESRLEFSVPDFYANIVLPRKRKLQLKYLENCSPMSDFMIVVLTLRKLTKTLFRYE